MKKWISTILLSLLTVIAIIISPASSVLAGSPGDITEQKLQDDLHKYKYPYSEVPSGERVQLVQHAIKTLNKDIENFRPGQGTTLTYLKSTLKHMQEILSTPVEAILSPQGVTAYISGTGTVPVAIDMIYYGWNYPSTDQRIINAVPEFLVNNSSAGPWNGNADINTFKSAGIKYFEYIDGGYEGTQPRAIPNDLASNLKYITAAKNAGAYGIFLDEVSDGIWTSPNYAYLKQITDYAHSLGLKVVFNTGMPSWADRLMNYCDYLTSSEDWQNTPLTSSQSNWAKRTWLLTQNVSSASEAASLTEAAWSKGIRAHFASESFLGLPVWLESYISEIRNFKAPTSDFSLSTTPSTISFTSGGRATFSASIIASGGFAGPVILTIPTISRLTVTTQSTRLVSSPYPAVTFTVASNIPGTYIINLIGTSGTLIHTASVSVLVNPPPTPALSVSISTDSNSYRVGQIVRSTVTIKSLWSPVANVTVNISIKNEIGTTVFSGFGMTNSTGTVSLTWNTKGASLGTYTVILSASKSGYTSGSASASIRIR